VDIIASGFLFQAGGALIKRVLDLSDSLPCRSSSDWVTNLDYDKPTATNFGNDRDHGGTILYAELL
jgi:hypothetical protein